MVLWWTPRGPIPVSAICTVSVQFVAHTGHALPRIGSRVRMCAALAFGEKLWGPLFRVPHPSVLMSYETLFADSRALALPHVVLQLFYCPLTLSGTLWSLGKAVV